MNISDHRTAAPPRGRTRHPAGPDRGRFFDESHLRRTVQTRRQRRGDGPAKRSRSRRNQGPHTRNGEITPASWARPGRRAETKPIWLTRSAQKQSQFRFARPRETKPICVRTPRAETKPNSFMLAAKKQSQFGSSRPRETKPIRSRGRISVRPPSIGPGWLMVSVLRDPGSSIEAQDRGLGVPRPPSTHKGPNCPQPSAVRCQPNLLATGGGNKPNLLARSMTKRSAISLGKATRPHDWSRKHAGLGTGEIPRNPTPRRPGRLR